MHPILLEELIRQRSAELLAAAEEARRVRAARRAHPDGRRPLKVVVGTHLVTVGFRLMASALPPEGAGGIRRGRAA
jgi:hypothetical protein